MKTHSTTRRFILDEDSIPEMPLMMLITLDTLRALGGSGTIQELVDHAIEAEGLTEEEQAYLMPNGRDRRFYYYLAWSRTHLNRGKALENSARGVWAVTELGEGITTLEETQRFYAKVNEEARQRAKAKQDAKKGEKIKAVPEDAAVDFFASDQDEANWQNILLAQLMQMDPSAFERLAQRLLREAGFVKVEVRGKTGDGGLDGVGILRVNLVSFQVYFQCKRWGNSVGAKEIRDFRGALQGRADKGLFITTSSFTKQASDEATRDGAIAIDLIDGDRLCELLKQFDLGVKTERVERVIIDGQWLQEI